MDKLLFSSRFSKYLKFYKFSNFFQFSFLLLFILLLSSCSNMGKKDGPPNFHVDVNRIPDATPKVEPLSKYGNLASYRVFGRRYYTMRSSKNYEQVGVASWYGTKFHARRTSSGEPYNMLAMTAAHKTLPLPTYVEVTNLRNQRKVIVKVNDRGPFEGNRLIDLSYVAAKKLGITAHGTAKVKVKAIDPNNNSNTESSWFNFASNNSHKNNTNIINNINDSNNSDYNFYPDTQPKAKAIIRHKNNVVAHAAARAPLYLQIGSFRSKTRAEKFRSHIVSLLKAPVKIKKTVTHHQPLYQVQIGPIKNSVTAHKMTSQLKRLGIKSNKLIGV
jgi:rare lipoprotein A